MHTNTAHAQAGQALSADLSRLAVSTMPPSREPQRLSSRALLAGDREVLIDHDGSTYRLRLTSLGKLILTK